MYVIPLVEGEDGGGRGGQGGSQTVGTLFGQGDGYILRQFNLGGAIVDLPGLQWNYCRELPKGRIFRELQTLLAEAIRGKLVVHSGKVRVLGLREED